RSAQQPKIKFMGLFDSVIGTYWPRLQTVFHETKIHNSKLPSCVEFGFQLLSIDDDRNPSFQPLLWKGKSDPKQVLLQMWMPGVHGDVGGGSGATFLNNVALLTMIGY